MSDLSSNNNKQLTFSSLVTNQACRVHGNTSSLSQSSSLVRTKRQQNIWPIFLRKSQYHRSTDNEQGFLLELVERNFSWLYTPWWMVSTQWSNCPYCWRSNALVEERFPGRLISHRSDFQCSGLLDLPISIPFDFYLCWFVKERVFRSLPANIRELKVVVTDIIQFSDVNTLRSVVANFCQRINNCIMANGGTLKNRLYLW